jgi:hypothetical protein
MLSKADSNEKNHSNTEQTKDRILRAKDIIPGEPKGNSEKTKKLAKDRSNGNIPNFDLADDIMAKHREITAVKRKAPAKKIEAPGIKQQAGPTATAIEQTTPSLLIQQKIVADIVARDIEKLCCGDIN